MAAPVYYTAEMVRALPDDGNRYETVYGELLVTPAPRAWHQVVLKRLLFAIEGYLEGDEASFLLQSPADISWSEDTLVQPDLFVVDLEEARSLEWNRIKNLQLVIEILSPSTARHDRFTKRRLYQEQHIPLYWIVDGDEHQVEVWRPELQFPEIERERITWRPPDEREPLVVDLAELFKPI